MLNRDRIKKLTSTSLITFLALGLCTITSSEIAASGTTQVTTELMLSIDVSGSVDSKEYKLQMEGYEAAFRDADVIAQIENMPDGLAVGVQFWASKPAPVEGWQVLKTEADSIAFANYLKNLSRPSKKTTSLYGGKIGSSTNVTGAIRAATSSILENKYIGDTLVIDVSGDGRANGKQYYAPGKKKYDGKCGSGSGNLSCPGVINARDAAVSSGIIINGLPIENGSNSTAITDYYTTHVKGSSGFVETAAGFSDFTRAAVAKIYKEISGVPTANPDIITTDEDSVGHYNLIAGDPNNGNDGQDSDPNGDTLTVTKFTVGTVDYTPGTQVTMPSGAILNIAANGDLTYDPDGQFESMTAGDSLSVQDTFTYTITDPGGETSSATATLDINGAADNPSAADDSATTDENTTTDIAVLQNDSDPDTDKSNLVITKIKGIAVSTPGEKVILSSGATVELKEVAAGERSIKGKHSLVYDPLTSTSLNSMNDGDSSEETFTYTVSDAEGNTDQGSVTVNVDGITDLVPD